MNDTGLPGFASGAFANGGFNDWHVTLGASAHLGRGGVVALIVVAGLAICFSALSLIEERFGRGWLLA